MVKIDNSDIIIKKGLRRSKLMRLVKEALPGCIVNDGISPDFFPVRVETASARTTFFINHEEKTMDVYNQLSFTSAIEVAKKYKENGEGEYTINRGFP